MKEKYILEIEKKSDSENKHIYRMYIGDFHISAGISTHENIIKEFYDKYPCIIKYVNKIKL